MGDPERRALHCDITGPARLPGLRRWLREALADPDGDPDGAADAELVCTELVTNALEHAGGACVVRIVVEGDRVRIEVDDDDVGGLTPGASRLGAHRGRGLALVGALASWGVVAAPAGKTVWAVLPLAPGSGTPASRGPVRRMAAVSAGYATRMTVSPPLTALLLNCTLTPSPAESSTQLMGDKVLAALEKHGVSGSSVRLVDLDVRPGVEKDMGEGDAWPAVRERMLAADVLVVATPTWVGHMSSVASRVMERLDAELSELDDQGRPLTFGKVALVAVVGNEDGAHKITADLFQGLNDVGFTVPAQGGVYWNGEAMTTTDFKDLDETPEAVGTTIATMTTNAVHLASLLRGAPYPAA